MQNAQIFTDSLTQLYLSGIKYLITFDHPEFDFEKGTIVYNDDEECYLYSGFSDEELRLIRNAERKMMRPAA